MGFMDLHSTVCAKSDVKNELEGGGRSNPAHSLLEEALVGLSVC